MREQLPGVGVEWRLQKDRCSRQRLRRRRDIEDGIELRIAERTRPHGLFAIRHRGDGTVYTSRVHRLLQWLDEGFHCFLLCSRAAARYTLRSTVLIADCPSLA